MRNNNMFLGLILIIIGLIIGLNALEITNINIFFRGWWTLFIILPTLKELLKLNNITSNLIGLIIGVVLLLGCNEIITFTLIYKLLLPVILIIIGISILFKNTIKNKVKTKIKNIKITSEEEYYAIFGFNKINPKEDEINGANINAVFGELHFDLTNTKITKDIVINATSVFGGMTILVPENVNVVTNIFPIFGEINNKVKNKDNTNTIYIRGIAMFGGIDIK